MKRHLAALIACMPVMAAWALQPGECFTEQEARKRLAAEGQKIVAAAGSDSVRVTFNSRMLGYVLHVEQGGRLCVESVLERREAVSAQSTNEVCDKPGDFPDAVQVCALLKKQAARVRRVVSADASRASLSEEMSGPVVVNFAICVNPSGRPYLCGRTETLKSGK